MGVMYLRETLLGELMRCILYARVSLEEAEQFGLASQLRALREYAAAKGYIVIEELWDDGYSGADLERPAINKVRALVRARQVDVVVVHGPDRLGRTIGQQCVVREECERFGVQMVFVTVPTADTMESRLMMNIIGSFADYEREKIKDRTLRGRQEKAKLGFIVGGRVPFGFKYLGKAEGERGKLVIDESQAVTVRQIFESAASGQSIRGIAAKLNEDGIAPFLSGKWGKSSVANILKNETYIGQAHYNRRKRCRSKDASPEKRNKYTRLSERPAAEWISIETPAIVTRPLFERVAVMLERNKREVSGRPTRRYLLRGLVWCGKCQHKMNGDPGHGSPCYRCHGRDRSLTVGNMQGERCQQRILGKRLDATVWRAVIEPLLDPKQLQALVSAHRDVLAGPTNKVDRKHAEAEIERLKARESRAVRALLDAELGDHQQQIRRELATATARRRQLESTLKDTAGATVYGTNEIAGICHRVTAGLRELSDDQRQEFLRLIIEAITVTGSDVSIRCALPSDMAAQNRPQCFDDRDSIDHRVNFTIHTKIAA